MFRPFYSSSSLNIFASPYSGIWFKMIASTMAVDPPAGFWEPLRKSTLQHVLDYVPVLNGDGHVIAPHQAITQLPIVTYISRQGGGRRLVAEDHENLVKALKELEWLGLCTVHVAAMEKMTLKEQLELMAKSTVRPVAQTSDAVLKFS
jgi:hypothetical protein